MDGFLKLTLKVEMAKLFYTTLSRLDSGDDQRHHVPEIGCEKNTKPSEGEHLSIYCDASFVSHFFLSVVCCCKSD